MTEGFFPHVRGGITIYCGGANDAITNVRFVLAYFGEDPTKVIEEFWKEHRGDFLIVPVFAYGLPPRRELSTQRSLSAALQTVCFEAGSPAERGWKTVCEQMSVAWPKRFQQAA
jgi:hypothetical protein